MRPFAIGAAWSAAGILLAAASPAPANAQDTAATTPPLSIDAAQQVGGQSDSDEILVVADSGASVKMTADSLRDAARAYARYHASLAPNARFMFRILGDAPPASLHLFLRHRRRDSDGGHATIDVPVTGGRFLALPAEQLISGNWEMRMNGARGARLSIQPVVLSPGSTMENRRFGDLRLQCRVAVAFARLNIFLRAAANAIGPCDSPSVRLLTIPERPVATVTISGYDGDPEIRADGMRYRVPLHVDSIGNEARMVITYR